MKPIKIGLDADVFGGAMTGVANYCLHLLKATIEDPSLSFVGFSAFRWRHFSRDRLVHIEALHGKLQNTDVDRPRQMATREWRLRIRALLGKMSTVRSVSRSVRATLFSRPPPDMAFDLFHAFRYLPLGDLKVPTLPVVYDLSFVRFPHTHPKARLFELERLPTVLERAPLIQTISEFSKREIISHYGCAASKVFIASPAASEQFQPLGQRATVAGLTELCLGWRRYLLAVGTLEPRKNLRTIIQAYAQLRAVQTRGFPLVIVGNDGWGNLDLPPETDRMIQNGSLRILRSVQDWQLRSLYEGAIALLYPSIYEGFGMPVVEALACGTEVVHSSNTSMDEVTNGLAKRIAAVDTEAWRMTMVELIDRAGDDDSLMRDARMAQAGTFSWVRSAALVKNAYSVLTNL